MTAPVLINAPISLQRCTSGKTCEVSSSYVTAVYPPFEPILSQCKQRINARCAETGYQTSTTATVPSTAITIA